LDARGWGGGLQSKAHDLKGARAKPEKLRHGTIRGEFIACGASKKVDIT